jgi:hypothetical protein
VVSTFPEHALGPAGFERGDRLAAEHRVIEARIAKHLFEREAAIPEQSDAAFRRAELAADIAAGEVIPGSDCPES